MQLQQAMRFLEALRTIDPDMSVTKAQTLLTVASEADLTLRELQSRVQSSQAAMSRTVAALGNLHWLGRPGLGLLEEHSDAGDGRQKRIRLSDQGRRAVKRLFK